MNFESLFQSAVKVLEESGVTYALAGGLICSVYRHEKRLTQDIDFAIELQEFPTAHKLLSIMGLSSGEVRLAQLRGGPLHEIKQKSTPICLYVGRCPQKKHSYGVDLLLNVFQWSNDAISRAQQNKINFGFALVPALTVEDVILSKLDALRDNQSRFKDLDDLQSIFRAKHDLDLTYLCKAMQTYQLPLPKALHKEAHYLLGRVSRGMGKKTRS